MTRSRTLECVVEVVINGAINQEKYFYPLRAYFCQLDISEPWLAFKCSERNGRFFFVVVDIVLFFLRGCVFVFYVCLATLNSFMDF